MSSPSERIAASENAISEIPAGAERAGQLVELHCRRAPRRAGRRRRAAAREGGTREGRAKGSGDKAKAGDKAKGRQDPSTITSKIRSLLVGASVVVIVLGTFKMAMTLLDTGSAPPTAGDGESSEPAAPAQPPRRREQRQAGARRAPRALDDLADADRQAVEQFFRAEHAGRRARSRSRSAGRAARRLAANDITGAIPTACPPPAASSP